MTSCKMVKEGLESQSMFTEGEPERRKVLSDEECGRLRLFRTMLLDDEEFFNLLETDVFPKGGSAFTIGEVEKIASLALEANRPDNN